MPGPLDGIKVLDITRGLNGPCCGVWLSDYGAEVIKVEPRLTGEMGRQATPIPNYEFTPYFTCANRGKKGITLDLTKKKGQEVALKLAQWCDILLNNFRPGVLEKLGLGYEVLRKHNPGIIYVVSSGFGAKGPIAERGSASMCQTKDGYVMLLGSGADLWPTLCQELGLPELIDNPRFDPRVASREDRAKSSDELAEILDQAFQKKTTKEWLDILQPLGIRIDRISTHEDIANDPQAQKNGYIIGLDLPGLGLAKLAGTPAVLSETPAKAHGAPPKLGEHTEEVLTSLGYSRDEITAFREEEVISS